MLFGQWNNNKVVSFLSTLGVLWMSTIKHKVGSTKVDFKMPKALTHCKMDNFMGGVDNADKDKKIGSSLTCCLMFKKWCRMGLIGVFDFMPVNGRQA